MRGSTRGRDLPNSTSFTSTDGCLVRYLQVKMQDKLGEGFADSLLCKGSVHSTLPTKAEPRPTITLWLMVVDSDEFPGNPLNAYDIAVMLH